MLGLGETLLIIVAVLLVFGASRLPKAGRALGEGIREFKAGLKSGMEEESPKKGEDKPQDARKEGDGV